VCVSTLVVTLPSTMAAIPLLPCEGHDNEIAGSLLGGLDDGFVRMILLDLNGFADDTSRTRFFGDAIQYLFRARFGARGMLSKSP